MIKKLLARNRWITRNYNNVKFLRDFTFRYHKILRYFEEAYVAHNGEAPVAVINTPCVMPPLAFLFESLITTKLSQVGCRAYLLLNDRKFTKYEEISITDTFKDFDLDLKGKYAEFHTRNNPFILKYSRFLDPATLEKAKQIAAGLIQSEAYVFQDIDLYPYIDASLVRFYKTAPGFWQAEPDHSEFFRSYTENAVISVLLAEKVDHMLDPTYIFTSHGIYSTYGPFYKYFKNRQKKVVVYDFGHYKPGGFVLTQQGLVSNWNDDGFLAAKMAQIEDTMAAEFAGRLMGDRTKGLASDLKKMKVGKREDSLLEQIKGKIQGRNVYAMFTNVLWDASNTDSDHLFDNWSEWILETIAFFVKQPDKFLIIRAHPGEAEVMPARVGTKDIIERRFGHPADNFDNVFFIPNDADIKSYSLFEFLTMGLIYNGTIGLEMMYADIPVLMGGTAPYYHMPFSTQCAAKEDYFKAISQPGSILALQQKHRQTLLKYIYFYFHINEIPLEFSYENIRIKPPTRAGIGRILNDPNLDHIVDTIVDKKDFFQDWEQASKTATAK